jgi:hypothetical protein
MFFFFLFVLCTQKDAVLSRTDDLLWWRWRSETTFAAQNAATAAETNCSCDDGSIAKSSCKRTKHAAAKAKNMSVMSPSSVGNCSSSDDDDDSM